MGDVGNCGGSSRRGGAIPGDGGGIGIRVRSGGFGSFGSGGVSVSVGGGWSLHSRVMGRCMKGILR